MANEVWAMDFVHDQLYDGRRLRILTVVDAYTRYVPAIEPRERFTGADVVGVLERICARHGHPKSIRVDQGPEFISRDLELWAYANGVELDFSRPGKPTDNAFIESLNGKFRAECLNAHWFMNLADARGKCERWRREYNTERPHSAIGYRTPAEARKASALTSLALEACPKSNSGRPFGARLPTVSGHRSDHLQRRQKRVGNARGLPL